MYIAIAGNIGAGKTTLTKMLAKYYGWEPRFESVSFNPYLEDYYGDIKRWAFCLETYFLKERFKDMLAVQQSSHTIVQDRSIFEGVYVFVRNNYERGDLSDRDYTTFMELFDLMKSQMKMPDMMIYLRKTVPALIAQIQKRGRDYEQTMQIDYLKDLNDKYEDFKVEYAKVMYQMGKLEENNKSIEREIGAEKNGDDGEKGAKKSVKDRINDFLEFVFATLYFCIFL